MDNVNILPILSTITGVDAAKLEADLFVKEGEVVKPVEGFEGKVKELYAATLTKKMEDYATQKLTAAKSEWEKGVPVAAASYLKEQAKALNVELADDDDLDTVRQKVLDGYATEYVTKNGYQKGAPKEITDDDVKRHKVFTEAIGKIKADATKTASELKAQLDKTIAEYEQYKASVQTERLHAAAKTEFARVVTAMKPVVADGKQAQFNKLLGVAYTELLDEYDVGFEGEGSAAKPVLYEKGSMKTGKPVVARDAAYNPLKWEDEVMKKFREFHSDYHNEKQNPKGSGTGAGGNDDPADKGAGSKTNPNAELIKIFGKIPATVDEALEMFNSDKGTAQTRTILRRILDDLRTRA